MSDQIKTLENWKGDLGEYLGNFSEVDSEMYWHFVEVLPPIMGKIHPENAGLIAKTFDIPVGGFVQLAEPYDHESDRARYATIVYSRNRYWYIGNQHRLDKRVSYVTDKDGVVRYNKVNSKAEMKQQLNEFTKQAQSGKVVCLSDLMVNAGM